MPVSDKCHHQHMIEATWHYELNIIICLSIFQRRSALWNFWIKRRSRSSTSFILPMNWQMECSSPAAMIWCDKTPPFTLANDTWIGDPLLLRILTHPKHVHITWYFAATYLKVLSKTKGSYLWAAVLSLQKYLLDISILIVDTSIATLSPQNLAWVPLNVFTCGKFSLCMT